MRILVSDIIVWDPVNMIIIAIYPLGVLTSVEVQLRNSVSFNVIIILFTNYYGTSLADMLFNSHVHRDN